MAPLANPSPQHDNPSHMQERDFAIDVVRRLRDAGHEALFAGGCVRDELLGLIPKDYDVATSARPEEVQRLFRRTIAVGASFGVIDVIGPRIDGQSLLVQVATFRADGPYSDGRRPDDIRYCSAREDALRRDFTINGMFLDPLANSILDYVGGQDDLAARRLRAIGDAAERIREDKLRMLRAVRFATRFRLTIDLATAAAVQAMASEIIVVSAERIADELRKLLTDPRRAEGVGSLGDLGLARVIVPQVATSPSWERGLAVLAALEPTAGFPLAFASLLFSLDWEQVDTIARRLRLSNLERDHIVWLVKMNGQLDQADQRPASQLKPLLAQPGADDLLALHRARARAEGRDEGMVTFCEHRRQQWRADGSLDPEPLLTGDDLKLLGLRPGPTFRTWLDAVRAAQLDDLITTRDEATALVQRLSRE